MDLPSKLSFINFMKDKNKGAAPCIVLHKLYERQNQGLRTPNCPS